MKTLPFKTTLRTIIDPGEYYVTRGNEVISTLLGSCVAACLYDPVNRIFGMNHFLLAYRNHDQQQAILQSEEGRYGVHAMELLINELMKLGAKRSNLQAKCFGGGNVLHLREDRQNRQTVGDVNVQFIKEFLQQERIPMINSCLGGNHGRNVHFVGSDFSVFLKRIDTRQEQLLAKDERRYWKQSIDEHEHQQNKAEFW